MSAQLPVVASRDAIRVFERAGYRVIPRRGKGSHVVMASDSSPAILVISSHRELPRGLLRALIRQSGLTVDEFVDLL